MRQNVSHVKVAVASPQANGQVERVNRILKSMLGKLTDEINHDDWVKRLLEVEYAINNSTHSTCRDTPSRLCSVSSKGELLWTNSLNSFRIKYALMKDGTWGKYVKTHPTPS